jgi:GDP-L-fucose synthase
MGISQSVPDAAESREPVPSQGKPSGKPQASPLGLSRDASIYVAGHGGLVGAAIVRLLQARGFSRVLTASRAELDLRNQAAVEQWFAEHRPEHVLLVAGTVGGILANRTRPAEFIYDNLMIHASVVHAAYVHGVRSLLYLGSSCIYPRLAQQPMAETELLAGPLEPTNEPYAVAKIAGIKLCQSYRRQYGCRFISGMPTNLYGPNDNFSLTSGHVLPALMRKFHEAREQGAVSVEVWGSGTPRREFLHVDDLAAACLHLLEHYDDDAHVNIGSGTDVSIRELAELVRDVVYPSATIHFDASKPDGAPRKLLDVRKLDAMGWRPRITLAQGIQDTYAWFVANAGQVRGMPS